MSSYLNPQIIRMVTMAALISLGCSLPRRGFVRCEGSVNTLWEDSIVSIGGIWRLAEKLSRYVVVLLLRFSIYADCSWRQAFNRVEH